MRLSETDRAELTGLGGRPFAPMGRPMREYLLLPPAVRQDPAQLTERLTRSLAFAATIPVVTAVMEDAAFPAVSLRVPLKVDVRAADNWEAAH